jgi:hypothetical protein
MTTKRAGRNTSKRDRVNPLRNHMAERIEKILEARIRSIKKEVMKEKGETVDQEAEVITEEETTKAFHMDIREMMISIIEVEAKIIIREITETIGIRDKVIKIEDNSKDQLLKIQESKETGIRRKRHITRIQRTSTEREKRALTIEETINKEISLMRRETGMAITDLIIRKEEVVLEVATSGEEAEVLGIEVAEEVVSMKNKCLRSTLLMRAK